MSIIVIATIYPLPEHRDEVITIFEGTIPRVHDEDLGCELYALHEGRDRLVMIEKWVNSDALAAHGGAAAMADAHVRLEGKLAQRTDVEVLRPHPAGIAAMGTLLGRET
jgi:quinol monooxygenase YgiN